MKAQLLKDSLPETEAPELTSIAEELRSAGAGYRGLVNSMAPEDLNRRPSTGRWSVADCVAHVTRSNREYLTPMRDALARVDPSPKRTFRQTFLGGWMVRKLEPPVRGKLRSPKLFLPPNAVQHDRASLLSDFEEVQRELLDLLETAAARDLSRVKMSSPVSRLLRMNLWDVFRILAAHERRHLWQARNVAKEVKR
jgi:hypothetical protein